MEATTSKATQKTLVHSVSGRSTVARGFLSSLLCGALLCTPTGLRSAEVPPSIAPESAGSKGTETPKAAPTVPKPAEAGPWALGTEHRFVWFRGSDEVGETRFRLDREGEGDAVRYRLKSRRKYEHGKVSQEAEGETVVQADGIPLSYRETLYLNTLNSYRSRQDTRIDFEKGKAKVRYVPNEKEDRAVKREIDLVEGTCLFASQNLEHWTIIVQRLAREGDRQTLPVLYPDFNQVYQVRFDRSGTETLTFGNTKVETVVWSFSNPEQNLEGRAWLDESGRLLKLKFPAKSGPALQVQWAPERRA
jgi:hypothetical protein